MTSSVTFVCFSPCLIRVAVPDFPELLCGDSFTVAESAAEAVKLSPQGTAI